MGTFVGIFDFGLDLVFFIVFVLIRDIGKTVCLVNIQEFDEDTGGIGQISGHQKKGKIMYIKNLVHWFAHIALVPSNEEVDGGYMLWAFKKLKWLLMTL